MAAKGFWKTFLETKWFGLCIGLVVFGVFALLLWAGVFDGLELKILDLNFRIKTRTRPTRIEEGVTVQASNPGVSEDIWIVGVDERALQAFKRWPFPRYRHADLVHTFSRITAEQERERALFLDFIFSEPDAANPQDDAVLVSAIRENGRVFLETIFPESIETDEVAAGRYLRQRALNEKQGSIVKIDGDWHAIPWSTIFKTPLAPYGAAAHGSGHVGFYEDSDEVFRRASLIIGASELVERIDIENLSVDTPVDAEAFERLTWIDRDGQYHDIELPLADEEAVRKLQDEIRQEAVPDAQDRDGDGTTETEVFTVEKYRVIWVPSVALSLAAEYLHVPMSSIEVKLGDHIRLPSPKRWAVVAPEEVDPATGEVSRAAQWDWVDYVVTRPARIDEATGRTIEPEQRETIADVLIPIDAQGQMLINFMGERSSSAFGAPTTYTARSYTRYASSPPSSDRAAWDETRGVANKIVMVGAFAAGMAEDEKSTPFGLMFGVEVLANTLNTIIMDQFLRYPALWVSLLILFGMVMLTSLMSSRAPTLLSLGLLLVLVAAYTVGSFFVFEFARRILPVAAPVAGAFLAFLAVIAYRTVFAEKDKRQAKAIFSKIVDPAILEQILAHPPELGGQDKELTVFFSDIRNFSAIAEKMTSQELVNYLNRYFTVMTDIIKDYGGTQDKLIGDAVMGFWGAPTDQLDHALLACKCALRQMDALKDLNEVWRTEGRETIDIGIGISTGIMTAAYMGSKDRLAYTVIGDAVNLGSRLEGMNKAYYDPGKGAGHFSRIIISDNTYEQVHQQLKDRLIARELDTVQLKGRQEPTVIYELIGIEGGYEPPKPSAAKGKILAAEAAEARQEARRAARRQRRGGRGGAEPMDHGAARG